MSSLSIINEQEVLGKNFRVYGTYEEPLFLAKDVAEWIEYSKTSEGYYNVSKMVSVVDDDEKTTITIGNSGGKAWFLTENGLYEVLMQSRKPIAKKFKKEVKKILKTIRKHGMYATEELLDNPDIAIAAFTALKEEREKCKRLEEETAIQKQQIAELQPKASYYDVIINCKDLLSISKIAKDYGWSAKKLNNYLHEKGIQYKQGNIWLLYQEYAEKGYTSTKTHAYSGDDGKQHSKVHTYWTQRGRKFIYNLLKENNIFPLIELS